MKKIKLSKKFQARNRLMRNMLSSLILFEQIQTTPQKAKALKAKAAAFLDKVGKADNEVNLKRYIASTLYGGSKQKAFDYKDKFGAIKTYRVENRLGDNAKQVIVRLEINSPKVNNEIKDIKVKNK
jgi:ribosomal protein L17